ncbi:hypothetical protein Pan216_17260 [Planctomycetes bacterium Pan216]|uniref:Cytochrome c domain-containing protein n=1 Tax=Kolteria novifilia TaxID=2527975 RepID=A0A518B1M2_9BACT|nr:hypothetical protein Pan216_17260 [Planctomycetes bacterium Pan216]
MLRVLLIFGALVAVIVGILGFRGHLGPGRPLMVFFDMDFQPKYQPQGQSAFFSDGRAQRTPPTGTVAFGGADFFGDAGAPTTNPDFLQADDVFYRGKEGETYVKRSPVSTDMPLLRTGRQQYGIYCAVCHGPSGRGNGILTEYGFVEIAKLTDPRVRSMPDGQIYHTIANGKGLMNGYGHQIPPAERWAVVAYVRALQWSQNASMDDVPTQFRAELEKGE